MSRFLVLAALWLANMGLMSAVGPIGSHPYLFMAGFGAGVVLMVAMIVAFPVDLHPGTGVLIILLLSAAGRFCFWTFPPDDDIYRYLWEGHIQNFGLNPYLHAPSALRFSLADQALPGLRDAVNHPEFTAVYPPLVLMIFRLLVAVNPDPQLIRGFFLVLDMGTIAVLCGITRFIGIPVARVLYYAANPLSVVYVTGEVHLDVLQVFLMTAGIWGLVTGRERTGFVLLGAAVMSKFLALVVLPFFVNAGNWKKALFALMPVAVVLPFADAGLHLFDSLVTSGLGCTSTMASPA